MLKRLPTEGTAKEFAELCIELCGEYVSSTKFMVYSRDHGVRPVGMDGHVALYRNPLGCRPRSAKVKHDPVAKMRAIMRNLPADGTAIEYQIEADLIDSSIGLSSQQIARHAAKLGLVRSGNRGMVAVWTNTNHKPDTI